MSSQEVARMAEVAEELSKERDITIGELCILPLLMESPHASRVPARELAEMAKNGGRPVYQEDRVIALARKFRGGGNVDEEKIRALIGRA